MDFDTGVGLGRGINSGLNFDFCFGIVVYILTLI